MATQDEWTWPSTDCNGIPLVDPVTISFQGTVVVFARQAATPVTQLYTNVRLQGADSNSPSEWAGWNPLPMAEPSQSTTPGQPTADALPLLRLGGMDLLTMDKVATTPAPADAPFRVVTDNRTISCFRQSTRGSLYLDRFILVQVPGGSSQDPSGGGSWELRRVWEVRYRRSGLRDVPNGPRDTLNAQNLLGEPFLEPTVELPVIAGITGGAFDVALVPTAEAERMRWHIVAVTDDKLTCLSYPQDPTGRIDLSPATAESFTISPAVVVTSGGLAPVTPYAGIAVAAYQEQETSVAADGTKSSLRRTTRLMVTAPVRNASAGLSAALAVYDFTVSPDGKIPAYPAGAACTPIDGTLSGGHFTPTSGNPDYLVPDSAVLPAGTGTIASVLLGQPQPAAAPSLLDSSDGLVHLYFTGPADAAGGPGPFLVAQHNPIVTRVQAAVGWTAGGTTGTFTLIGLRSGTSLNGLTAAVDDCSGQADLCTLTIHYGTASGLPGETWHGVPRDALQMISILDGQSFDDPSDPAVLSGAVAFYDLEGQRPMARLPLAGGDPGAHLTLVSHRPDVPLASAATAAPSGGTTTLTLGFTLPGGHTATQTWAAVPTDTTYLTPILGGDSTGYDYKATGMPVYGLATDVGTILLFAASAQAVTVAVGTATDGAPAHCNVTVTPATGSPIVLASVGRDQASLVAALRGSAAVSAVFTYISADPATDPVTGLVPNQSVATAMDLRGLSLLFDVAAPAPAGNVTAASVTAAVLQGRSFESAPPAGARVGRGMLALTALSPTVPLLGARPTVGNGPCPVVEEGRNGRWLVAPVPSALSFGEQNAMTVPHPGAATAPTRAWTIEAWARPTDGTPSRVVAYNGATPPPLAGVVPSYFLGTVGQPALQYNPFTPGGPYAGSYANVPAYPAFGPAYGQAFTWEAWIRPDEAPCPVGGTNRLGCVLQGQDTTFPDMAQWQLGLNAQRHLTFGLRTGPAGNPAQSYVTWPVPLAADTWTHVAVTGSVSGSVWTFTLYANSIAVQTRTDLVPYPVGEAPFLCIGANDIQNTSMFGAVSEVRFWTFAATPAELHRTMNASLTGHEPGLAGYWPLSEDPKGQRFANYCAATGDALDASLKVQAAQEVTTSSDGTFVSVMAGVGGAPALLARALLPANHWNHLAAVYQAAGALSLNPSGMGAARADYGVCENSSGLVFGQAASVEAWVQMSATTHIGQAILSQWGVTPSGQAFQFGVDADGHPYCAVTLTNTADSTLKVLTGTSTLNVIDSNPHHAAATFAVTTTSNGGTTVSTCTVTMYVDGQAQTPAVYTKTAATLQVTTSSEPVTVGISALSTPATGPVAYSVQAPFIGVLTGIRFWSVTLTQPQVQAAMNGQQAADSTSGVVSAWWFGEQTGVVAADDVSGNDLTLSDTDMWAAFASISTLDLYGNGIPLGLVVPAPADIAGGYPGGGAQLTVGAYTDQGTVKDGFSGQLTELRLWSAARSPDQLLETIYRGLSGDEADLNAYWTLNSTTRDETGRGADGTLTGNPLPVYVTSQAPISNEGPQVRNVYGGQLTDFQEPLTGRAAAIEYAETETRWDGSPFATMRRAYFFANPALALFTGYGLGEMAMVYIGQVQTNPTLIGYIEGAPPCPSENLSRPLDTSIFGYNSYMDATSVTLEQDETNTLTFTSSDYRTSLQMNLEVKAGVRYDTFAYITIFGVQVKLFDFKGKLGLHHKSNLTEATQQDESYASSWTNSLTDTLGLRGMWERGQKPKDFLNPVVGRRYQPFNLGYALVESMAADVFALRLRSTGAMVGRVVVPNLAIPPDRNVLTFKIDPTYIKNGTLDGKVGLVNDPTYPDADVQRGSYFKPEDAYARAAAIDREAANLRAYYDQYNAEALGRAGTGSPSLTDPAAQQFYDFTSDTATRGIVNRYVWTALGGLHQETEQFSATHTRSFSGLYDYTHATGLVGEIETGSTIGVFGGLDLLFGGEIKVQVGKTESQTEALSMRVSAICDPMLQGYDIETGTYTTDYCPGKVDVYRFMTFYLPPSADNGDDFRNTVVDAHWLQFSSDPNAIALRQAQMQDNGVWRVLHRVTYVSRVPPRLDTNPAQTVAPDPPQAIDVQDNPVLILLVQTALGQRPATPANVGAAVAAVLAPPDGITESALGKIVPWWETFLASTRGSNPDPNAVALLDRLLNYTVTYMQAGYQSGLLKG